MTGNFPQRGRRSRRRPGCRGGAPRSVTARTKELAAAVVGNDTHAVQTSLALYSEIDAQFISQAFNIEASVNAQRKNDSVNASAFANVRPRSSPETNRNPRATRAESRPLKIPPVLLPDRSRSVRGRRDSNVLLPLVHGRPSLENA